MNSLIKILVIGTFLGSGVSVSAGDQTPNADTAPVVKKCEHGVKETICTRCHPKLEPVFKAKGDWCEEHGRAESQCAICHPELLKEGIKP